MANEVAEKNVNTEVAVKDNTQLSAQKSNNKVTDYSLGIFGTSDNFIMAMQMAKDEGWLGKNGSKWKTMPQLMLRYRAASFFSSLNCPELTMGIYTKEEIEDGDFKEYPIGDMKSQVEEEIANNANQIEFLETDANNEDAPDFMKE